ncbi:S-adenosyl-L-methionine-dependent methyltransferase [Dipodascopsis uninucleata]
MNETENKWSAKDYTKHASFVPILTSKIVSLLNPQAEDKILDIGAGDGILSLAIAGKVAKIDATDSSPDMVEFAKGRIASAGVKASNMNAFLLDGRHIAEADLPKNYYNKVFSNAALHWILKDRSTGVKVFRDIYDLLPHGGEFVAEHGGHGNVAEVRTAITFSVKQFWQDKSDGKMPDGTEVTYEYIERELDPWYFPDTDTVRKMLEEVGFTVEFIELEYRPTELPKGSASGAVGWLRTFGFNFWKGMSEEETERVINNCAEVLKKSDYIEHLDKWLFGYVRCRFRALK